MTQIDPALRDIVNDPALNPSQKAHQLAVAAENMLDYPALDAETRKALDERVICDMYEGHAPYKPRYVLPDYSVVLKSGSEWLELPVPKTLDEAVNTLMIAYHHVPSVTGIPVYIGQLDDLLLPFTEGVSDEALYTKIKLFWRYLDRVLPDAFMHANIGPSDNRVARAILRVDAELKQVAPNLTFLYDPQISSESILAEAAANIVACSKPHVAHHPTHAAVFDDRGYGIVSCYNALPLAGGASTLTRINLREVAMRARNVEDFLNEMLPHYVSLNFRLIRSRVDYLFNQSGFFGSFLVDEGWIARDRFTAMFGIFAMAEAVNLLQDKAGLAGRYGLDDDANTLGYRISARLAELVEAEPLENVWRGRAMLHAQAGLSNDSNATPGVRIPYGSEPDPVSHVKALAPHHCYYPSGISEILTLDETVKANPEAVLQLCKGALASGFREFTANVDSNDLVRVTGYMVRLSDVARHNDNQGSRINTTGLGAEAANVTGILDRKPRVVANERLTGERQ
ncbi:YjjI family glycine radical enzyme [Hoeflea prorocentri]|uniref:YjjI family glycine radical enzyme n=1 Tax=Hoeflea prorocentri TaxID=1922333 RepID=A0A9X3ULX8_9HYPH|nr:YjjI family glycine radical enzyme [Hoeflea prorocentri]MCY6383260.1 YjjI family glycine radical enzyme [Hoeflea prorocentri]MDA5401060.1 YjjI family glycine radical enzyme [Hoeflea prorocentri]